MESRAVCGERGGDDADHGVLEVGSWENQWVWGWKGEGEGEAGGGEEMIISKKRIGHAIEKCYFCELAGAS